MTLAPSPRASGPATKSSNLVSAHFVRGVRPDVYRRVEKALEVERGARYPVCVTGKGRRPPEDRGGVWGYADLREKLADPTHREHADMLDWLGLETGAEFDAQAFDADEVNVVLSGLIGVA